MRSGNKMKKNLTTLLMIAALLGSSTMTQAVTPEDVDNSFSP